MSAEIIPEASYVERHLALVPPIDEPQMQRSGYYPRPSDEEIEQILDEYMGVEPALLATLGLHNCILDLIAKAQLKTIGEDPSKYPPEDRILWSNFYAHILDPLDERIDRRI